MYTREDDEAALLLLAAVCRVAAIDAARGSAAAAAWLVEIQATRPRGLRLMDAADPRGLPGRFGRNADPRRDSPPPPTCAAAPYQAQSP